MVDDLVEKYRTIAPATIGHIIAQGFMDTALRPIFGHVTVVGRAVTVRMPAGDTSRTRPAIQAIQPGDVLVISQAADTHVASWGEMTSLAAKMRGAVGVIIDGSVTDVVEIEQQEMPTFARAVSARVGRRLNLPGGAVNEPVECGGVMVSPGDLIVADDNGILVMSPSLAAEIYPAARQAEDRSPFSRQWLKKGGELAEITGKDPASMEAMLRERGWLD